MFVVVEFEAIFRTYYTGSLRPIPSPNAIRPKAKDNIHMDGVLLYCDTQKYYLKNINAFPPEIYI